MIPDYFWAKTTSDGKPGISVLNHMKNVGCVAKILAENSNNLLQRFNQKPALIAAFAAIHDIGKITPGFQMKCEAWLNENELLNIARNGLWDTRMESDHGKSSHAVIQSFLVEQFGEHRTAKFLSAVLGGHHGRLNLPNDRGFRPQGLLSENRSGIDWECARKKVAQEVWSYFNCDDEFSTIDDSSPFLWWQAGLTSVSDWIGSDERFFSTEKKEDTVDRTAIAAQAVKAIGFQKLEIIKGLSFHDLFHDKHKPEDLWVPNEMQEKTLVTINGPGVYVIEAPMGIGKTEAALWTAYNLLSNNKAQGIYFALPTQATSNRIHIRMNEFIKRIAPISPASRLIHANSWLLDKNIELTPSSTENCGPNDDARNGRDWFSSAKRALLAPFGVGTVDQALLGVVAAKHFFVRHFALAGKIVILDEVHSYDLYTGTLIDKLITTLEGLGCTVIVLSATLTSKRRAQIISGFDKELNDDRPLIAGRMEGSLVEPVLAKCSKTRNISVCFASASKAAENAITLAAKGGCVLWICNTVEQAQLQFRQLQEFAKNKFEIGLLHSRFPFWRREELENLWMNRLGKNGENRCGSILVSTQIVEQSVDLDADLLITELAPTDMLLQRLGRLWRHDRSDRCAYVKKSHFYIIEENKSIDELMLLQPKKIISALGGKAHVYHPYVLLRTLQIWKMYDQKEIAIPGKIRELLEATYMESVDDPDHWEKLFYEKFVQDSNERFIATMNSNYWQLQLPDEEGVQTRLNDFPTVPVVLCKKISGKEIHFLDNTTSAFEGDKFLLATGQAIHKNIVKVPLYCFDTISPVQEFSIYLHGSQSVGIVDGNNDVKLKGLKDGFNLYYTDELGLVIDKPSDKENI